MNRNLLFRHRFHGIVSLRKQIARPKERLPRKSQCLRKKSRAIRCRPCLARLIESSPGQLRRHLSISFALRGSDSRRCGRPASLPEAATVAHCQRKFEAQIVHQFAAGNSKQHRRCRADRSIPPFSRAVPENFLGIRAPEFFQLCGLCRQSIPSGDQAPTD